MTDKLAEAIALKPCPFCGGTPKYFKYNHSSDPHRVICTNKLPNWDNCQAQLWPSMSKEDAINNWNTRTPTTGEKVDVLEALKSVGYIDGIQTEYVSGYNDAIDHITSKFDLFRKVGE